MGAKFCPTVNHTMGHSTIIFPVPHIGFLDSKWRCPREALYGLVTKIDQNPPIWACLLWCVMKIRPRQAVTLADEGPIDSIRIPRSIPCNSLRIWKIPLGGWGWQRHMRVRMLKESREKMWDCDIKSRLNEKKKSCWAWRFKTAQTDFRGVFIHVRSQRFLLLTLSRQSFVLLGWANTRSSQEKLNLHLNPFALGSTYGCGRSHRETESGVRGEEKHTLPLHGHSQPSSIQSAAEIIGYLMKVCLFFFLLELQLVRSSGCEFIKDQLIKSLGLYNFHSYLQGQSTFFRKIDHPGGACIFALTSAEVCL